MRADDVIPYRTKCLVEKHISPVCVVDALSLSLDLEQKLDNKLRESQNLFSLLLRVVTLAKEKGFDLGDLEPECVELLGIFFPHLKAHD